MHGTIPTELILDAYREGIFPMAESAEDESFAFYKPAMRGLIPIVGLHIPARLLKTIRQKKYRVTMDEAFREIIVGCAAATTKRDKTWINRPIRELFLQLHREGHAHSVECWTHDGRLAGGLYGIAIGGVFCGESMVSFEKDASKVALAYLCAVLWKAGFGILDTQFINPHLLQFDAYEMPQEHYEIAIKNEMNKPVSLDETMKAGFESIMADYLAMRAAGQ